MMSIIRLMCFIESCLLLYSLLVANQVTDAFGFRTGNTIKSGHGRRFVHHTFATELGTRNNQWNKNENKNKLNHAQRRCLAYGSQQLKKGSVAHRHDTTLCAVVGPTSSSTIATLVFGSNVQFTILMALTHVILGSLGTPIVAKAINTWYFKIDKPSWTPPNRIFAPTWTLLYSLMGIAYSRVLQTLNSSLYPSWTHPISVIWIGHMLLNVIWAPIFFGLKQLRAGLYINYGLLLSLVGLILPWYQNVDPGASYMLVPYTLWLMYATCLNRSICLRNSGPYNAAKFYSDLFELQKKAATYASS